VYYNNYIERISKRFKSRFDEIDPHWNFDIGVEFELELATLLEELLPDKYGVCRGFVTPKEDDPKGDDIIVYDKMNFPLLKPTNTTKFTKKESVPLEATYAYIEAKNTVELVDKSKSTYIGKALKQIADVKSLKRAGRPHEQILNNFNFKGFVATPRPGWPDILNPLFTILFARGVRINGEVITDIKTIKANLPADTGELGPDLIILGPSLGIVPHLVTRNDKNEVTKIRYESPFCIEGRDELLAYEMPEKAYGFGLTSLTSALEFTQLTTLPWTSVLGEVLIEAEKISAERRKDAT